MTINYPIISPLIHTWPRLNGQNNGHLNDPIHTSEIWNCGIGQHRPRDVLRLSRDAQLFRLPLSRHVSPSSLSSPTLVAICPTPFACKSRLGLCQEGLILYRANQALFVRFPCFLFVSFYSCLLYISLLPSFVAASFRPRRSHARSHRNDLVKFIRLQSPILSPPLLASRAAYLYLIYLACQAGNQAIIDPFSVRVLFPQVSYAVTTSLARAFSLTQDSGLGPQTIPELT